MKDKIFDRLLKCLKDLSLWVLRNILWVVILPIIVFMAFVLATPDCNGKYVGWICNRLGVEGQREAIQMLGVALIAVLGIYMANRRAVARDKIAEAQAKTVEGDKERRIQERFRDGIKLLGNNKESVRRGGVYALFHLALEEESLRQSIAEILCAHIRGVTAGEDYRNKYKNGPSMEIQSLMTLLFEETDKNRSETLKRFWKGISPDLSGGYFRGIKLVKAQFQGARMNDTQFQKATLINPQFHGAGFSGAQFQKATLGNAQFHGAYFAHAKFHGAEFWRAQCQGATLISAEFQGARIHSVEFQGTCLWNTQFQGVNFHKTKFEGAFSSLQLPDSFQQGIKSRVNAESEFSNAFFAGGLIQAELDIITSQLKEWMAGVEIASFKERLQEHVGKPASHTPPEDVETGKYSKEEANQWIADYEKAMNEEKGT